MEIEAMLYFQEERIFNSFFLKPESAFTIRKGVFKINNQIIQYKYILDNSKKGEKRLHRRFFYVNGKIYKNRISLAYYLYNMQDFNNK
jgi:hypothetical protein